MVVDASRMTATALTPFSGQGFDTSDLAVTRSGTIRSGGSIVIGWNLVAQSASIREPPGGCP